MSERATRSRDSREVLVEAVCERQQYFLALFSFAVVFFLLQAPYLFVADPNSALYVVATLNIIGTSVFAVTFGVVLWFCSQRN
ncbi:MAG: hypothetical protein V5A28_01740 [Haloarculaceae archaeon]